MIFTIYIKTSTISIANTINNNIYKCRMLNVYSQNGKLVANVGEGIMIIDNEKIEYGRAIYMRQKVDHHGTT